MSAAGESRGHEPFLVMHDAERPWAIRSSLVARIVLLGEWVGPPPLDVYSDLEEDAPRLAVERVMVVRTAAGERALRISNQLEVYLAEPHHVVPLPVLCRPRVSDAVNVVGLVVDGSEIRFLIVEPEDM